MDPLWKLWSALLSKATEFEDASDINHVEDVLVAKRVLYDDEWSTVYHVLRDSEHDPEEYFATRDSKLMRGERDMRITISKISQINRLRRNKLLLIDWNNSRPW